jgi:eukaryotic-like serine/threonine-protein kinase
MSDRFSDEQWRNILELANAAVKYPKDERLAFLASVGSSPDVIKQVLVLTEAFEQPSEPSTRIGFKVGHFTILEHLGRGGMGDVYSAQDLDLERKVALKFLSPEALGHEGAGERFIREARTASALNHPNIVTIHEVIRSDSSLAIVMELVPGIPLRKLCGSPLPTDSLLPIARQIANALAAAHGAGVVHRDMKPENVMVLPDGRVKVVDFGLARRFGVASNTSNWASSTSVFAGTWRYMSPEQCKGETLTGASDVFSFGLVLYELAAGRHAFQTASAFETLQAIAGSPTEPPSKWNSVLPKSLDALILSMLDKDPAQRPSAGAIARVLAESEPSQTNPRTGDPFPLPRQTRSKMWFALAAVLCLAGMGAWFWRSYSAPNHQPAFFQVTTLVPENRATAAAISPDGKFTAYANIDGLFLKSNQSGETRALPGVGDFVADQLSWFRDNSRLIASGFSEVTNRSSLWSVPTTGAPPTELRLDARNGVPSPDGTQIAFINRDRTAIWLMNARGKEPRNVVIAAGDDTFWLVLWSADGRRLAFQRRHYSGKLDLGVVVADRYYKRSLESVDLETGTVTPSMPDLGIESAAALPDGRILFLRLDPPGSDISNDLWEARTNPLTGALRGPPRKIASPVAGTRDRIFGMSATSDGTKVMVLKGTNQNAVFVADFERSPPRFSGARRLTLDERSNFPHAWTADSNAVIFESDRDGSWDIFKQRIDQHSPESLAASPSRWEVLPQLTPEGLSVLYAAGTEKGNPGPYKLMRVPVQGGSSVEVPTGGPLDEFRCSFGGRCVLRITVGRQYYIFRELDPVRGVGRELARTAWLPSLVGDWALSQDGSQVAIPNHDSRSARIRVINLEAAPNQPKERELDLAPITDLSEIVSAADGKGWFLTVDTSIGKRILYVKQDGQSSPLGDIQGWVVPAPDGRKVAYLNRIVAANAWVIDRH